MKTGFWCAPLSVLVLVALGTLSAAADDHTPLSTFRDCSDCPEMVVLPPGEFLMGATPEEHKDPFIGTVVAENPQHKVTIGYSFALGRFEITVAEFDAFVKATGLQVGGICGIRLVEKGALAGEVTGTRHPEADAETHGPYYTYITDGSYAQPGLPVTPRQPAVCVSRNEAGAYLAWLAEKTGKPYRLATEAEWEYAARAGTTKMAHWGNYFARACDYANFADRVSGYQAGVAAPCSEKVRPVWTAPVGSYKPNPWGLYDMAGNVQEMVEDCWHGSYHGAPADGSPWRKDGCLLFVARGGDYELLHISMRASERLFFGYEEGVDKVQGREASHNARSNVVGFRVALSLDETAWDRK